MALAKLEGNYSQSSTATCFFQENGAGGGSITVAGIADYYLTSTDTATALCTVIANALTAATTKGATYTCTVDDNSDNSTGKVTIAGSGGTLTSFRLDFSSSSGGLLLRDALGFTGNISGSLSYQSTKSSRYIWLPSAKRVKPISPDGSAGTLITDGTVTMAPTGVTKRLQWAFRYVDNLEFGFIRGNKAWISQETVGNESWESFFTYGPGIGKPFRYHLDRSTDATYVTWVSMRINDVGLAPEFPGFVGATNSVNASTLWHVGPMQVAKKV